MIEFIVGFAFGAILILIFKHDDYEQGYRDALAQVLENLVMLKMLKGKQDEQS